METPIQKKQQKSVYSALALATGIAAYLGFAPQVKAQIALELGENTVILDDMMRDSNLHPNQWMNFYGQTILADAIYGLGTEDWDSTFLRQPLFIPWSRAFIKFGTFSESERENISSHDSYYLELPPDSVTGMYPDSVAFTRTLANFIAETAYPGQRYHVFEAVGRAGSSALNLWWNRCLEDTLGDTTKYGVPAVPTDGYLVLFSENSDSLPWAGAYVAQLPDNADTFFVAQIPAESMKGFYRIMLSDSVVRNHFNVPDPVLGNNGGHPALKGRSVDEYVSPREQGFRKQPGYRQRSQLPGGR